MYRRLGSTAPRLKVISPGREGRHVIAPGKQQRRTRGAEQGHGGRPAVAAQPAPGPEEQAQAAQRPVEQRRQPDDPGRLERRSQERVTGILLADPPPAGELHPLLDTWGACNRAGQLSGQAVNLGGGQRQEMPLGYRHDRGAIRIIVRLHQPGRGTQHHHAQHRERGQGDESLRAVPAHPNPSRRPRLTAGPGQGPALHQGVVPGAANVNAASTAESMTGAAVASLMGADGFSASTATT